MKFCSNCGAPVSVQTPEGDDRPRYVCAACKTVHYQNPIMVVGCIPEYDNRVLLCRRAIEPQYGKWTLPAGYLEKGETLMQGAIRETREEAGARVEIIAPYTLFNLTFVSQIYLLFRARLVSPDFEAGQESLDVRLFSQAEVPWDAMAFTVIRETLNLYFRDRPTGQFPLHMGDIHPDHPAENGK